VGVRGFSGSDFGASVVPKGEVYLDGCDVNVVLSYFS
jgi:hypothetical protein